MVQSKKRTSFTKPRQIPYHRSYPSVHGYVLNFNYNITKVHKDHFEWEHILGSNMTPLLQYSVCNNQYISFTLNVSRTKLILGGEDCNSPTLISGFLYFNHCTYALIRLGTAFQKISLYIFVQIAGWIDRVAT